MRIGPLVKSRSAVALLCSALAACATTAALAAPAGAWEHKPPEYSLSVVEGADTLPEDTILHVSGSVNSHAEVVVSILHNGLPIQSSGEGGAWLPQVPQVGDVVTLESPQGTPRGRIVYDGLPSLDPTVCAGSTNFSGQRSAGEIVEGGYYTVIPHSPYSPQRTLAQVQVLSGPTFQGGFLTPLASGETVFAVESLVSPLMGGATFTYSSENDRPVGACPVPPPPPPPPPPLALSASIASLGHASIHRLLGLGWSTRVRINQAGTIVEDLYLHRGTLPAFAASKHGRRRGRAPAPLLARGTAKVGGAGTVTVTLHVTSRGRAALRHARSVRAVLITTLHASSGARLTLERRSLTLHR